MPASAGSWSGHLVQGGGWMTWRGVVGEATAHQHLAAQAIVAPRPIGVWRGNRKLGCSRRILIDPMVPHRLEPVDYAELLYVEPTAALDEPAMVRMQELRGREDILLLEGCENHRYWGRWLKRDGEATRHCDPRILASLSLIDRTLATRPLPLADAARAAGLSRDRFRHLFAAEVGFPYSRFVRWRRLLLAVAALQSGRNATAAAHEAGFADSAHCARTLKATFGVTTGALSFIAETPAQLGTTAIVK